MFDSFVTSAGYASIFFVVTIVLISAIASRPFQRFFSTVGHLTYKRKREPSWYEKLANAGYIYRWSVPILKRFKAKE